MKKIFHKLFLVQSAVILACLFTAGKILRLTGAGYVILFIVGAFAAVILAAIVNKLFLTPIDLMQKAAQKMPQGGFSPGRVLSRKDELGGLARQLNHMSAELQNKISEIMQDRNELQAILANMVEGVIVVDKNDNILLFSEPARAMLDLRSQDVLNRPYWEVIRNAPINSILEETLAAKKSLKKEIEILDAAETHFNVQTSCVFKDDGALSAVTAVFHDITELKRFARLRSEFVANVSHELKTPLTSIKGFVETLRDTGLRDKENALKFLNIIQKHTERLEHLVADLLTISSLESNAFAFKQEKIDLKAFLEAIVSLCKESINARQHALSIEAADSLPSIMADRPRLEQAILNLLENAIKFTEKGGKIILSAQREGSFVQIAVRDTGIGISSEHLPRIFERFYRVDKGRSRDLGGTGLGLAIVKHIIQGHGGRVAAQSEPGKGSVFSVFLPIKS